jgi:hypothetical protein
MICFVTIYILIFLGLFEVFELILSYYYVVLIDCLWPLCQRFLLHKPKLLPYTTIEFLSSYMLLLHGYGYNPYLKTIV